MCAKSAVARGVPPSLRACTLTVVYMLALVPGLKNGRKKAWYLLYM